MKPNREIRTGLDVDGFGGGICEAQLYDLLGQQHVDGSGNIVEF